MTIKEIDKKIITTYDEWNEKKTDYRSHTPLENRETGEKYRKRIDELFSAKRAELARNQ